MRRPYRAKLKGEAKGRLKNFFTAGLRALSPPQPIAQEMPEDLPGLARPAIARAVFQLFS
jgi:hypothetical protein